MKRDRNPAHSYISGVKLPAVVTLLLIIFLSAGCSLTSGWSPRGYAVIYGVTQYDYVDDLVLPREDAEAMAALFGSQGYEVLLRIDNDNGIPASLDQLKLDIDYVKDNISENGNFVFYFAGHGGRHLDFYGVYADTAENEDENSDSDDEWILLYESLTSPDYEDWPLTAVSDDTLNGLVAEVPTPRKLIILDSCNSGGFVGTSPDVDTIPEDYITGENIRAAGIYSDAFSLYFSYPDTETDITASNALVLSAAGELEFSWENNDLQHGVFTYYLLESAEMGDRDNNGIVTVDEIYLYTSEKIIDEWNAEWSQFSFLDERLYHPHLSGGPVTFALFAAE